MGSTPPVVLTVKVAFFAMLLQLLAGIPLGLVLAGRKKILFSILDIVITIPMIFPPMALGCWCMMLLGRHGFLGQFILSVFNVKILFTSNGVLLAATLVGLPFMVKSVQAARQQMDDAIIGAAYSLGKNRLFVFFTIVLPNIRNGIIAGVLLAFGRSLGEVGISMMLGGNIIGRTETLSLAIYNAVLEGDFHRAGILSLILSVIAGVVLIALNILNRKGVAAS